MNRYRHVIEKELFKKLLAEFDAGYSRSLTDSLL
jgi:hypothetical protein